VPDAVHLTKMDRYKLRPNHNITDPTDDFFIKFSFLQEMNE
jgi:hypothetical protein